MKLAGCMVAQNYNKRYGTFRCLKSLCDFTTVLDDNSIDPDSIRALMAEDPGEHMLLTRPDDSLWNDTANRTMLMYRAYVAGCDFVLPWSADVLPSAKLYEWIQSLRHPTAARALSPRIDFYRVELRELWDSPYRWRSDGVWAKKRNVFLQRNWFFDPQYSMPLAENRLHAYPFPPHREAKIQDLKLPCCIYHFGSIGIGQRMERVAKYAVEDKANQFQADYTYLNNEAGAELTPVPREDQDFFRMWGAI